MCFGFLLPVCVFVYVVYSLTFVFLIFLCSIVRFSSLSLSLVLCFVCVHFFVSFYHVVFFKFILSFVFCDLFSSLPVAKWFLLQMLCFSNVQPFFFNYTACMCLCLFLPFLLYACVFLNTWESSTSCCLLLLFECKNSRVPPFSVMSACFFLFCSSDSFSSHPAMFTFVLIYLDVYFH